MVVWYGGYMNCKYCNDTGCFYCIENCPKCGVYVLTQSYGGREYLECGDIACNWSIEKEGTVCGDGCPCQDEPTNEPEGEPYSPNEVEAWNKAMSNPKVREAFELFKQQPWKTMDQLGQDKPHPLYPERYNK